MSLPMTWMSAGQRSERRMRGGDAGVIHQRVEPDVGDEIRVEGQGNAPVQPRRRARDAQVFQRVVLEEAQHFVAAVRRRDEIRVRLDVINQPLLVRAELEIIIVLLQFDHLAVARVKRAVGQAVFFREKRFLLRGIKARVGRLVKMAGGVELGERGLDEFLVARLGGADEIVVGQFQFFGERLPVRRELVAIGLRGFAFGDGGLLDLLAVLVEAGQEKNLLAQAAPRPRDDVGDDLLVGMAEMRLAVDVINRGGDVKPFAHRAGSVADKVGVGKRESRLITRHRLAGLQSSQLNVFL